MDDNQYLKDDWRLTNQDEYFLGIKLYKRKYIRFNETWDHDHCSFCWGKFMVEDLPEVIHEGYASEDSNHWVCEECFEDFKDLFQWEVIIDENDPISDAS